MDKTIYFMVKERNGIYHIIDNFSSWFKKGNRWNFCIKSKFIFHEPWYNGKHYIFACNNEFMNEDICIIWKDSEVTKGTAIRQIVNEKDKKEGGRTEP